MFLRVLRRKIVFLVVFECVKEKIVFLAVFECVEAEKLCFFVF